MKTREEIEQYLSNAIIYGISIDNIVYRFSTYPGLSEIFLKHVRQPNASFNADKFHEEAVKHILTCNTKLYKALL